ncbi:MAG: hypothetical protein WCL23_01560 [Candidatus Moraniibacteriota bacterium]
MKHDTSAADNEWRFLYAMAGIVAFGLFSYGATVTGILFLPVALIFALPVFVLTLTFLFRWLLVETVPTRIIVAIAIFLPIVLLPFAEPTIFSGRDQGAIAEAAIELSDNGSLHFGGPAIRTFFSMYGPGKALNFPGFFYTDQGELSTQFPIGSIAFHGAFVSLFGTNGLLVGNGVLLFASLLMVFMIVRFLADEWYATGAFLAAAVSFLPLWFAKSALSENLSLFLFLFLSYSLVRFLRKPDALLFLFSLASAILLSATRMEGLFSLAVTVVLLFLTTPEKTFSSKNPFLFRVLPLLVISVMLFVNVFSAMPAFRSIGKAILQSQIISGSATAATGISATISLWTLFVPYGLFLPFSLGLVGIAILFFRKRFIELVPAALALPAFIFFLYPNITPDHPWMLRRYLFSLWPTLFIAFPVALRSVLTSRKAHAAQMSGKAIPTAIFAVVILWSLPATISTFAFSDDHGLADETASLSEHIGDRDLVLVDRAATGDPYAMPAGPLRFLSHKNAAYFFNPSDYEKIRKDDYDHIFLLAPADSALLWEKQNVSLIPVTKTVFSFDRLERLPLRDPRFPTRETVSQEALLFELKPL